MLLGWKGGTRGNIKGSFNGGVAKFVVVQILCMLVVPLVFNHVQKHNKEYKHVRRTSPEQIPLETFLVGITTCLTLFWFCFNCLKRGYDLDTFVDHTMFGINWNKSMRFWLIERETMMNNMMSKNQEKVSLTSSKPKPMPSPNYSNRLGIRHLTVLFPLS